MTEWRDDKELGPGFPVISIVFGKLIRIEGRVETAEELDELVRRVELAKMLLPFKPIGDPERLPPPPGDPS